MAARCAERFGVSLAAHRSSRVNDALLAWAHLVLVMEGSQKAAVDRSWPQARGRVRLLGDFLATPPHHLRDPWGQSEAVFDEVFERLRSAADRLAVQLEASAAGSRAD
jgi:protein-tyrosine phosphatase